MARMARSSRLTRVLRGVRRWRGNPEDRPIPVDPDLPDGDWRHLRTEIEAAVETKGGPVAARRRARTIALTYESLSAEGRLRFLTGLARDFDHEDAVVDAAMDAVFHADGPAARRAAEAELRAKLRPRREILLRRMAGQDGGLPFLISMRTDLLDHRRSSPELATLDTDTKHLLANWFDVGLLRLERLTWDTPASFLEKLIEYEAVHAIESWDDLKNRLGPGRRCYAFVHPGMPQDPLIFVEVALTKDIARELGPLLEIQSVAGDVGHEPVDELDADTAIFYSISNCHRGLSGVSLGDFLIKSVAEDLSAELGNLRTFATLSPVPGFRQWLRDRLDGGGEGEPPLFGQSDTDDTGLDRDALQTAMQELLDGPMPEADSTNLTRLRPVLLRLMARYLLQPTASGRAPDPVAHFHLSNGAQVAHINWLANHTQVGWDRGLSMMVNYRYELKAIEANHDRYVNDRTIAASDPVRKLLDG